MVIDIKAVAILDRPEASHIMVKRLAYSQEKRITVPIPDDVKTDKWEGSLSAGKSGSGNSVTLASLLEEGTTRHK